MPLGWTVQAQVVSSLQTCVSFQPVNVFSGCRKQEMCNKVLPLFFTAAIPPTHSEGIAQTGTNRAAGTYMCVYVCTCMHACVRACVHECMCVHTTYMFVWVSVSNCVFVYVNDLCAKTSSCKCNLVFSSFKEVITHQTQDPIMREFCPSGFSCYNYAHDLSLSLNIVIINATQSFRAK